jgi:transcriptional regulator with XRE-family HTH domain
MTDDHSSYEEVARQRRGSEEYRTGFAEAQRAFLIGQAIRERRLALGLTQTELAERAGMTQPALSRLEAGGVVPTIPLLERISASLEADLIVEIAPHAALARLRSIYRVPWHRAEITGDGVVDLIGVPACGDSELAAQGTTSATKLFGLAAYRVDL